MDSGQVSVCVLRRTWEPPAGALVNWRHIAARVCQSHNMPLEVILSDKRDGATSRVRWAVMAALWAEASYADPSRPRWSKAQIGRFLGRHHTSVMYGLREHARESAAVAVDVLN